MFLQAGKDFIEYNNKLLQIIHDKLGLFMLLFVAIMVLQVLSLTTAYGMQRPGELVSFSILYFAVKIAIDALLNLTIIFLILYPYNNNWYMFGTNVLNFLKKHFINVFLCLLLFAAILVVGVMLFIIPGIIAFFFFHYCYLYVVIGGTTIKDSFKKSYELVRSIIALNAYVFVIYVIISVIALSIGGQYVQALFASIGMIYLTSLKTLLFVDNYKRVK